MNYSFKIYISNIWSRRKLILKISKMDIKKTYIQSYLGFLWIILDPIILLGLFYFIFSSGMRSGFDDKAVFIPYFFTGLVVYYFFTDSIKQGTSAISSFAYLVKKVDFKTEILPIVKIINCLKIHIIFFGLLFLILLQYGVYPSIHWLQVFYYLFIQIIMLIGLVNIVASLDPFIKDLRKMIPVATRLLFWGTPIFWHINRLAPDKHIFIKLNPLFYFVEGYRNSFINKIWFWENPTIEIIYVTVSLLIFLIGYFLYKRLKYQFGEQL